MRLFGSSLPPLCTVVFVIVVPACGVDGDRPVSSGRWKNYASGGMYVGTNPTVSPDGFSIVYSTPVTGHGDLYLFDRRRRTNVRLTADPEYDGFPVFSQDGRILFVREKNDVGHIWAMSADGTRQRQLSDGPNDDNSPSFSKDGKHIAFIRVLGGISHIWVMDSDGGNQKQLTNGVWFDGFPSFSPDGGRIVFNRQEEIRPFSPSEVGRFPMRMPEIFVMDADGKEQRQLTHNSSSDTPISFSLDGAGIFFHGTDGYGKVDGFRGVSVINVDGTKRKDLCEGFAAAMSPDGRLIAICTSVPRGIGVMNADGTGLQTVHSCPILHTEPAFSADGSQLVFVEWPEPHEAGRIMSLNLKTSKIDTAPKIE
jgi:Tol biopolymer transport system component